MYVYGKNGRPVQPGGDARLSPAPVLYDYKEGTRSESLVGNEA
jgi:hypothetical protein